MKHIKSFCGLLLLAFILMASNSSFAAKLPKMKDKYVTDAAGILSSSELKQLRADVKAMCDYYSTRILVGIVSTFDGYDIEEYAGMLSEHWNLDDENTMFILVKPRSDDERGEAMLVTSSDLQNVFTAEVCDEIVQHEMIPYFMKDDYFGGIESALEYMNNMSDEDDVAAASKEVENDNSDGSFLSDAAEGLGIIAKGIGKFLLWVLGFSVVAAIVGGIIYFIKERKKYSKNNPRANFTSDPNEVSQAVEEKRREVTKRKQELEELKRLEQESENLKQEYEREKSEYENRQHSSEQRSEYHYDDYNDVKQDRFFDLLRAMNDFRDSNTVEKSGEIVGKIVKGVAIVGGTLVTGKVVKDISDKHNNNNKKSSKFFSKPRLGGGGRPKNRSKSKLGGSGRRSKLGGNSSKGGW